MTKTSLGQSLQEMINNEMCDYRNYVDLFSDESLIDGWFTSKQLRTIASAMESLAEEKRQNDSKTNG